MKEKPRPLLARSVRPLALAAFKMRSTDRFIRLSHVAPHINHVEHPEVLYTDKQKFRFLGVCEKSTSRLAPQCRSHSCCDLPCACATVGKTFFFSHKPWNQTFAWPCTDSSRPLVHSSVTPSVGKTKKVNVEKQCAAAAGAIQSGRRARVSVCITHCPSPSLSLMRHCKMKLTFCPIHTKRRASGWRASWSSHHCRRC